MSNKKGVKVSLTRITADDDLLIRVSGRGLTEAQENFLQDKLEDLDAVYEVHTSWEYVLICKCKGRDWSEITPTVVTVLKQMLGRNSTFVNRSRRDMPNRAYDILGDAECRYYDDMTI